MAVLGFWRYQRVRQLLMLETENSERVAPTSLNRATFDCFA